MGLMTRRVFVDTSWWKALLDDQDDFHQKSKIQIEAFRREKVMLVTTNYIVDETATLLRVKCGLDHALRYKQLLVDLEDVLNLARIFISDERKAWDWFEKDWSKLSYTDCTSFAVMKRLGLMQVASFDQHFVRAGFTLLP